MRYARKVLLAALVPVLLLLAGCQAQFVSPYSADLQKRATDMLSDVITWEGTMRVAAGTPAADPRNPDVVAKLQTWKGDIEAMATIELGIDPGSSVCNKFLGTISASVQKELAPATAAAGGSSASAPLTISCESLPDIFNRMNTQVNVRIPQVLAQQCQLPWLSDAYLAAMVQTRATAGALEDIAAQVASITQKRIDGIYTDVTTQDLLASESDAIKTIIETITTLDVYEVQTILNAIVSALATAVNTAVGFTLLK